MTAERIADNWPRGSAVVRYFGNAYELCGVGRYDHAPPQRFATGCKRCESCSCIRLREWFGNLVLVDVNRGVKVQPITALYLEPLTPLARKMLALAKPAALSPRGENEET